MFMKGASTSKGCCSVLWWAQQLTIFSLMCTVSIYHVISVLECRVLCEFWWLIAHKNPSLQYCNRVIDGVWSVQLDQDLWHNCIFHVSFGALHLGGFGHLIATGIHGYWVYVVTVLMYFIHCDARVCVRVCVCVCVCVHLRDCVCSCVPTQWLHYTLYIRKTDNWGQRSWHPVYTNILITFQV